MSIHFNLKVAPADFQVGEVALSILHSMVGVHSDLDDAGELVTPTPRVKRILTSPRCLNHIAQVECLSVVPILCRY